MFLATLSTSSPLLCTPLTIVEMQPAHHGRLHASTVIILVLIKSGRETESIQFKPSQSNPSSTPLFASPILHQLSSTCLLPPIKSFNAGLLLTDISLIPGLSRNGTLATALGHTSFVVVTLPTFRQLSLCAGSVVAISVGMAGMKEKRNSCRAVQLIPLSWIIDDMEDEATFPYCQRFQDGVM